MADRICCYNKGVNREKSFRIIWSAIGGLLIYWGYNMSQAVGSQLNTRQRSARRQTVVVLYRRRDSLIAGLGQIARKGK